MIGKILTLKKRVGTIEEYEVIGWDKCKGLINDYIVIYCKKINCFQPITYESLLVNKNFDLDGWYIEDNKVSYEFINKLLENIEHRHMPNDIYVVFSSDTFIDKHGKKIHMDFLYINQSDDIDKQNKAIENIVFETKEEAMKVYSRIYDLRYDVLKIDIESIIELIVNYKSYRKNINKLYSLNPQVVK